MEMRREAGRTVEDMAEELARTRSKKMYPASSESGINREDYFRSLIHDSIETVQASYPEFCREEGITVRAGIVNLGDYDSVAKASFRFVSACEKAARPPTFALLCASLGLSRQRVYEIMRKRHDRTTEFLSVLQTVFAGLMETALLDRRVSEAGAIFGLKNSGQGYADRTELFVDNGSRADVYESGDPEEIARRYLSGMAQPTEGKE